MTKIADWVCVAGDPSKGQRDHLAAVVLGRNADNPDTFDVWVPETGQHLHALPEFGSRDELEAHATKPEHLDSIRKAQGDSHPLNIGNGRRRDPDFLDVLPWHNGVYPALDDPSDDELVDELGDGQGDGQGDEAGAGDGGQGDAGARRAPAKKTAAAKK